MDRGIVMVNVENITKVFDMISNESNYFNILDWNNNRVEHEYPENICGTPSCIGGWAEAIMKFEKNSDEYVAFSTAEIAEWMGLCFKDVIELFYPSVSFTYITRERAIQHLKQIIEIGEVSWYKLDMSRLRNRNEFE